MALVLIALVRVPLLASPAAASPAPHSAWPLAGEVHVIRGFHPPAQRWNAGHRGVDLLGAPGTAVRAAVEGTVTFAGGLAGRGVVVVAHRDGTRTTYLPVQASVAVGTTVRAGDRLGRLTAVGGHCLPAACLHWGWRRGTVYLDPMLLVAAGPVRLLPVWARSPALPAVRARAAPRLAAIPTAGSAARPVAGPAATEAALELGLVARSAAAGTLLGAGAVLALRRRRPQSSAGSSVANRV